ncbi:MAG TPA: hypothetical protein VFD85_11160 [Gemmatimonadales bacterium]|nr:hypothetical protein [Gemmatimonadales bacterium]
MRVRLPLAMIGGALLVAGCSDTTTGPTTASSSAQQQPVTGIFKTRQAVAEEEGGLMAARGGNGGGGNKGGTGIFYHGGPVIFQQKVAAVYWGTSIIYSGGPTPGSTGTGSQDGSLIGFFLRNLGGSSYFNINTTYFDGTGTHVQNAVSYTQYWADNSAPAAKVTDAQVQAEVAKGLASGALTYDPSTLYHVFTGPNINLGGGFGTQYCAYHGHFTWNGLDVKYSAMPYDLTFPSACTALNGSPNSDPAADAEVNTLAHETEETTTDEDLNAWFDRRGEENADKCAWQFGTTHVTGNGSTANVTIGGKDFLVQMNWINSGNGGCRQGL